jgi:hypothetical protein
VEWGTGRAQSQESIVDFQVPVVVSTRRNWLSEIVQGPGGGPVSAPLVADQFGTNG